MVLEVLFMCDASRHDGGEFCVVHCTAAGVGGKILFQHLFCDPADAGGEANESCSFNDRFNKLVGYGSSLSCGFFLCFGGACRVLSAKTLPAAPRLGFFAGFVVGVGEVACSVISPCKLLLCKLLLCKLLLCNGVAAWVSPCECARSGCAVVILQIVC